MRAYSTFHLLPHKLVQVEDGLIKQGSRRSNRKRGVVVHSQPVAFCICDVKRLPITHCSVERHHSGQPENVLLWQPGESIPQL